MIMPKKKCGDKKTDKKPEGRQPCLITVMLEVSKAMGPMKPVKTPRDLVGREHLYSIDW
jgi:hypothetical protein